MLGGRCIVPNSWCGQARSDGCLFRSAVDIVKIASETIEGLFNMRLALPVALVRALTEGLDEVLRKWVSEHCIYASSGRTIPPQAACVMSSSAAMLQC